MNSSDNCIGTELCARYAEFLFGIAGWVHFMDEKLVFSLSSCSALLKFLLEFFLQHFAIYFLGPFTEPSEYHRRADYPEITLQDSFNKLNFVGESILGEKISVEHSDIVSHGCVWLLSKFLEALLVSRADIDADLIELRWRCGTC